MIVRSKNGNNHCVLSGYFSASFHHSSYQPPLKQNAPVLHMGKLRRGEQQCTEQGCTAGKWHSQNPGQVHSTAPVLMATFNFSVPFSQLTRNICVICVIDQVGFFNWIEGRRMHIMGTY